ncbi:MAG: tRNA preQ1(34) S-adenosylmethionine ribosyltransferase-isomerase QueA [Myxococcota bacterium]
MHVDDLDYPLPLALIAQRPAAEREAARLLVLDRGTGRVAHRRVAELAELLPPALWVVNDTRVLPARLFVRRPGGGRAELLLVERRDAPGRVERWVALARPAKRLREGMALRFDGTDDEVRVVRRLDDGRLEVELAAQDGHVEQMLARVGQVPLPPYIQRPPDATDRDRYQTVFATHPGAVAAPTAGLHLSERLIAALEARGHRLARVTLHVGPGTFQPVQVGDLDAHPMHAERYVVSAGAAAAVARAREEGRAVVAVGTTVVRTLESAADGRGGVVPGEGRTDLFIKPPFPFRVVDALLTNFHLPRSTLLALVMAFGGVEPVRRAYREAIEERYRFYSYGDAMLIHGAAR